MYIDAGRGKIWQNLNGWWREILTSFTYRALLSLAVALAMWCAEKMPAHDVTGLWEKDLRGTGSGGSR
jgi:hypothetical protein